MAKLEGIIKLREKFIELESLENPILKKILHGRFRQDKFNFWYSDAPGYTEYKESRESYGDSYKDSHTDRYSDNHKDTHRDNHTDRSAGYDDMTGDDYYSRYSDHTDKGYSEHVSYGYNEHTDFRR